MPASEFLSKIRNINIVNRTFSMKKPAIIAAVTDVTAMITQVYIAMGQYKEMKETISKIIFSELVSIEVKLKELLLNSINSSVDCSINTLIPDELIDDGVDIELKNLDYKKIFKNSPSSDVGKMIYYDADAGLNSQDMNTFLWNVIQSNPTPQNWKGLITVTFSPISNGKTNIFNIKIDNKYRGVGVKEFNRDFINNLDIYDEKTLVANLFDSSFGVINNNKKSQNEISIQNEIDGMVDTIINSDDNFIHNDDGLYEFSTEKYKNLIKETIKVKFNLLNFNGEKFSSNNTFDDTAKFIADTNSTDNIKEKKELFNNYVDNLEPESETNQTNKLKQNILQTILKKLLLVISNVIVSPKILIILYLNSYIINGKSNFIKNSNIKSVIKNMKSVVYVVIKGIAAEIIDHFVKNLQGVIMTTVVVPTLQRKVKEKVNMRLNQLKSLVKL